MKLRNIGLPALLFILFMPAVAFAQMTDTGTTATTWEDTLDAVKALKTAWDQGIVVFLGAIFGGLHVLLRVPTVQKYTRTGSDDILDFLVPLSGVIVTGYSAGAATALVAPWYMAVVTGITTALGTSMFTSLLKEIRDSAGDEAKAASEAEAVKPVPPAPPAGE